MKKWLYLLLIPAALAAQTNVNSTYVSAPLTATSQTSAPINLSNRSWSAGTIQFTGVASGSYTATFGVLGSSDPACGSTTFQPIAINLFSTPGTVATTMTATATALYQVNLAGLYCVEYQTSGTFTATSITLVLTASPNAIVGRSSGGGGGGGPTTNPVSIAQGGTNATTASAALTNLGAAPTASPTFTGTITTPLTTAGPVTTSGGGVLSSAAQLTPAMGGTGQNTAASTGVPSVLSGVWSFNPQYQTWACQDGLGGSTAAATSGWPAFGSCLNTSGATWTITAIHCYTDAADSSTVAITDGSGNNLLGGTLTCSSSWAAGTLSSTTTIAANGYIKWTPTPGGTSKEMTVIVSGTY